MTTTVVGVFNNESAAQDAVSRLRDEGVPMDKISVIARPSGEIVNESGETVSVAEDHMTAGEGLTVGAVWGGLVGLAALAIPGIGPLVTSNIFAAALTGAVAGAATGGIAGALIDAASVPEEHAQVYEERVRAGGTLVTAQVDDSQAMRVRSILADAGAEQFNWNDAGATAGTYDPTLASATPGTYDPTLADTTPGAYDPSLAGAAPTANEQAYAESSKVGTVGGGVAGAVTGAAIGAAGGPVGAVIGGVAGAVTGGAVGAVGDTIGEKSEDAMYGDAQRTAASASYDPDAPTAPNYVSDADRARTVGTRDTTDYTMVDRARNATKDAFTDDQGTDTISRADQAYDDSSKVGTGGGALAGAAAGAVIGGVAGGPVGAVIGGGIGATAGAAGGAVGDTIAEESRTDTGAFSESNKDQYRNTADRVENKVERAADWVGDKAADAGNSVERATDTDLNRDGDIGRRG